MKNINLFLILLLGGFSLSMASSRVFAQEYLGDLTVKKEEKKEERIKPVPKTFSSHLRSINQAEKLDVEYYNLYVLLWNFAQVNYNHQGKLMAHMEAEKFRYTRYPAEFTKDLEDAMKALNEHYKQTQEALEKAETNYKIIREGIMPDEHETLDELWKEKIDEFESRSKVYFKSQHTFLITYKNLVEYIITQGGSYYYDSNKQGVSFYDVTGYTYFAKSIDTMAKISFDQKEYLRKIAPFLSALIIP
ncbi:MAG: hypothetical protein OEY94_04105 [Alphaproteobacteria bacterium]|nr:hypothetical protein [Alphaproteobacteria bacterium]